MKERTVIVSLRTLLISIVLLDVVCLSDAVQSEVNLNDRQRSDPNIRITDDAVIINSAEDIIGRVRHRREVKREGKQLFFNGPTFYPYNPNPFQQYAVPSVNALQSISPYTLGASGISVFNRAVNVPQVNANKNKSPRLPHAPCFTASGQLGKCASFRECYPYFKVPNLSSWGSWMFGSLDICNYYSEQPKQPDVFETLGVCCISPLLDTSTKYPPGPPVVAPVDEASIARPVEGPNEEKYSPEKNIMSWPPPIPTHPPDHTPATHPPGFGVPGYPTHPTVTTTTTKRPWTTTNSPWTTTKRPQNPWPAAPTHPPTTTTATPTQDSSNFAACGMKNGLQDQERIVGGHNADLNEWPWIAALYNNGRQFCGGSLIDDKHILTAAHCVAHMTSYDVAGVTVRLGDHDLKTNAETRHIEKRVRRVVRHRGFDIRTLYNDIAILTLDSPVQFSREIRPICLSRGGETFAGHTGTVVGWGSLRESGPQPAILQEVAIPIWTNSDCRNKYGSAAPGGIIETMLCAGRAAKDSCSGDSGGPLMVPTGGRFTQVGVVSWGIGCGKGQYPGVYSRVTSFIPWIDKNSRD